MATTTQGGDKIILSSFDTRILLALLIGPMTGYEIARQCEIDSLEEQKVSNGTVYPALKSLCRANFIELVSDKNYKITSSGKLVLKWKIDTLKSLMNLAHDRSKLN